MRCTCAPVRTTRVVTSTDTADLLERTEPSHTPDTTTSTEVLSQRMRQTIDRVDALELSGARRHSFVPYDVELGSPHARLDGRRLLTMSGYSYLGLSGDPRVIDAAASALHRYGSGCHGVRALAGSLPIHEELEAEIALTVGRDDAIAFGSGYAANVGTIGSLCGPGDTVIIDKADHASIVDGCRLSGATVARFRHNDPEHLDRRLTDCRPGGLRLVIVDSVYSMDGDIAPLPQIREVCDRHDALLMVDEAHALGVIGADGRGIEDHFDMPGSVDVKLGTLSKAIPSVGGWVAGSRELIAHLRYTARPFVFSASLPPAQVGASIASLKILRDEPERVRETDRRARRFRSSLSAAGIRTGDSVTSIIPIIIGTDDEAYGYAATCQELGVIGLPVVSPAVPPSLARLRIAITAAHTDADLETALDVFVEAGVRHGVVSATDRGVTR